MSIWLAKYKTEAAAQTNIDAAPGLSAYAPYVTNDERPGLRTHPIDLGFRRNADFEGAENKLFWLNHGRWKSEIPYDVNDDVEKLEVECYNEIKRLRFQICTNSTIIQEEDVSTVRSVSKQLSDILTSPPLTEKVHHFRKGRLDTRRAVQAVLAHKATGIEKQNLYINVQAVSERTPPAVIFDFLLPPLRNNEYASASRAKKALSSGDHGYRPEHIRLVTMIDFVAESLNNKLNPGLSYLPKKRYSGLNSHLYDIVRFPSQPQKDDPSKIEAFRDRLFHQTQVNKEPPFETLIGSFYLDDNDSDGPCDVPYDGPMIVLLAFTAELAPLFSEHARLIETKRGKTRLCGIVLGGQETRYEDPDQRMVRVESPDELQEALSDLFERASEFLADGQD